MECHSSDSKKIFKVFDGTKRKRTRKKIADDTNSIGTDDSNGGCEIVSRRVSSAQASFRDIQSSDARKRDQDISKRDEESSLSIPRSPPVVKRESRSPGRRHRRSTRDGVSLALTAGLVSTPRSMSPTQELNRGIESVPRDQDSFIYSFLEEAVKRDKKKSRHNRKHEERQSHDREERPREHRHHHRKHRDEATHRENKPRKEENPAIDQTVLLETFAKICAHMQSSSPERVIKSQSHKSLQCEVLSRRGSRDAHHHPAGLQNREPSKLNLSPTRIRSHDDCRNGSHSRDKMFSGREERSPKSYYTYDNRDSRSKYISRTNVISNKNAGEDFRDYSLKVNPTHCPIPKYYENCSVNRMEYYDERRDGRCYDQHRRPSRSFDVPQERYEERNGRRSARSDGVKERSYASGEYKDKRQEDKIYRDNYESKDFRNRGYAPCKETRRNVDFERASIVSRDDLRDRDKYSERERDSGLSVADGDTSTVSGRSNYLRVVKQEITEQREAMDKMMKLWKELMRCFKGVSQSQNPAKPGEESAANVRESAAEQLRLWRECMRRYETVARDVGDTDARLMDEINKQRSEMAEMATMWQECLQRYRDMSNDFNSLKQQLVTSESPSRMHAPPLVCAETEGIPPAPPYRLPANYPQHMPGTSAPYLAGGPLRAHASAPPAAPPAPPPWWWAERAPSPRRRSSPDSRASRERHRRHKDRDREDSRYKEKSKPTGARSEHRHRKR